MPPTAGHELCVLLFSDVVDSTGLKSRLGTPAYATLLRRHNALFEDGVARVGPGATIVKHTGDGYLATFATASDAVRFALRFQGALRVEPSAAGEALATRVGIHVGQVERVEQAGRADVVGLAADLAARVMSLATGGQVLLTRTAFDDARQFVREVDSGQLRVESEGERSVESSELSTLNSQRPIRWLAHGPYLFQGAAEPVEIFEVGALGVAPLAPPPDGAKARRIVRHDEEPVLGWRPSVGDPVPAKPNFVLRSKLGEGGFGEVWLARHEKLGDARVFKFCFDAERLRSLKREFVLFRLIKEALGERPDIVRLYDYNLDAPPFYLESEYTAGGNLIEWADRQGGIAAVPLTTRLELLAKIADAVAAAHSVGILHKDIKPANVLIDDATPATPRPRLSDFGIGFIADRSRLREHQITETGFTQITEFAEGGSSRTGTRLYAAPEAATGGAFTTQGDVFALGVLLYQLTVGDLGRPLTAEWREDVTDETLREDIAAATAREPTARASAATLVERARSGEARRAARDRDRLAAARLVARRRRRRLATTVTAALAVAATVGALVTAKYVRDVRESEARTRAALAQAEREREGTQAALDFLTGDVLAGATPERMPDEKLRSELLRVMVDPAAATVGERFKEKPFVEEAVRDALRGTYVAVGRPDLALPHSEAAFLICRRLLGDGHADTLRTMNNHATVLSMLGRSAEAEPLYAAVHTGRRRLLGDDHPLTLACLTNRALVLQKLGRSAEAEPLSAAALAGFSRVLGGDNRETLRTLGVHASVLSDLGRAADAEPLLAKAAAVSRRALGEDHPDTLASFNNHAQVLSELGRLTEAEPLEAAALAGRRRVLGDDHPETLTSMNNRGQTLSQLGRNVEAEPLLAEVASRRARVLGTEHPDTLTTCNNWANVLCALGRFTEAEQLHRDLLDRRRRVLGDDHPQTISSLNNLAAALRDSGRLSEAEPLIAEAAERTRHRAGPDHPDALRAMSNWAILIAGLGRQSEAEPVLADVLARRRRTLGADHPDAVTSAMSHANALTRLGRAAEAEPLIAQVVAWRRGRLGADHPDTLIASHNLAGVLTNLGRHVEAEPIISEVLERAVSHPSIGIDHRLTKAFATAHARCLDTLERHDEATAVRRRLDLPDEPATRRGSQPASRPATLPTTRPE